jgi:TolB-like protein/tetratricopeptide (TPR) repeat protein
MSSFVSELRRRNVLRVAAAYALVAWIIIEAGSVLLPTFGASDTTFQIYVILVLAGFVVSLILAWIFEVTPDGVKLEKDIDRSVEPPASDKVVTNYAIIGLLAVALIVSITFNVTDIRDDAEPTAAEIMANRASIAVLPFASRSATATDSLFADGVHDDLLTKLANIGSLRVISRTSVMEYRDTTKNLRQVGDELGVDTLLEGTVQHVGTTVRINVQLIDAETDEHLWARIYDRELTEQNLFKVQSEVSGEIAAALHTTLIPAEQIDAVDIPTENLRAYSLYTSARDDLYLRRLETLQSAKAQLEEALELDPDYAEARVALAEAIILLSINHQAIPNEEAFEQGNRLIEEAIDLNPDLSDAYATLGLLKTSIWSTTRLGTENLEAEAAFEQALALNPNNARAYMWFAVLRDAEQRTDEAIGYYHRSMQLDPLGRVPYNNLPSMYAQRGENEYAIRLWLDAIEIHPDWPVPYNLMTIQLASMGRLDEAMAWFQLTMEKSTSSEQIGNLGVGLYAQFGDYERARNMLETQSPDHPLAAMREPFLRLLDQDFAGASALMADILDSENDLPVFMYGIASDVALLAGDLEAARQYMYVANPVMRLDTEIESNRFTIRDIVKLAYIEKIEGNVARSTELLNSALPVVQSLPRLGVFGQGIRDAQIYAILGQKEDAFSALRAAIDEGFRTSVISDQWTLPFDPYLAVLRDDPRFEELLLELQELNDDMYERVLEAEASGEWQVLLDMAGAS